MLNPIFWKKVQGQKHPGGWGIVEHQIPSIKVLFKTNTKGHKYPSIRLLSKSKTQLVNQRKQKVPFSPGTAHSPEIQSYRTWWGAASPIPNDTPVIYYIYIYIYIYYICIYISYNRTHIRNAYIYISVIIMPHSPTIQAVCFDTSIIINYYYATFSNDTSCMLWHISYHYARFSNDTSCMLWHISYYYATFSNDTSCMLDTSVLGMAHSPIYTLYTWYIS